MLTLDLAQKIIAASIASAREMNLKPMGFVVLDERGALRAAGAEDGSSQGRWKVAYGKAHGVISMGISSRLLEKLASERPYFINSLGSVFPEGIVPVAGGLPIRDASGALIGAAGASGDTSDNDEAVLLAALAALGLSA